MWLFTQYGFFSAVCARVGDGSANNQVDEGRVMVRARLQEHLEGLKLRFPKELGGLEIMETPETDYRYRLFAHKSVWIGVLEMLGEEMDYDNFKISKELGWKPKYNNIEMICESYDQYLIDRVKLLNTKKGSVHQKKLKKGLLFVIELFLRF